MRAGDLPTARQSAAVDADKNDSARVLASATAGRRCRVERDRGRSLANRKRRGAGVNGGDEPAGADGRFSRARRPRGGAASAGRSLPSDDSHVLLTKAASGTFPRAPPTWWRATVAPSIPPSRARCERPGCAHACYAGARGLNHAGCAKAAYARELWADSVCAPVVPKLRLLCGRGQKHAGCAQALCTQARFSRTNAVNDLSVR